MMNMRQQIQPPAVGKFSTSWRHEGLTATRGALLQRKCACGGAAGLTGQCARCDEERLTPQSSAVPPVVNEVLRSPGRPLDATTRALMESSFGYDFSRVQVHTDARAAESARAVNALAYTVGRDVVFGAGQYDPSSQGGRKLLAHELAHVRQQGGDVRESGAPLRILPAGDIYEQQADRLAADITANEQGSPGIEICGNRVAYVRALTELEQMRGVMPRLAMAADGGSLLGRVQRLLRLNHSGNSAPSGLLLIVGIAVISLSVIGVAAKGLKQEAERAPVPVMPSAAANLLAKPVSQATPTPAPSRAGTQPTNLITPQRAVDPQNETAEDWLDQIEAAGFRDLNVDKLIEMKVHGVTGDYIREVRAAGFDPDVDKIIELRVHGITADYAQQIRATGLQVPVDKLLEMRIHGIDADWINAQNRAGFGNLSADKLIELKIHGVSSDYISQIRSLGFPDITIDKILEMRIHGITPDYVREAKNRFKDLTLDQILQLKIYNILK